MVRICTRCGKEFTTRDDYDTCIYCWYDVTFMSRKKKIS